MSVTNTALSKREGSAWVEARQKEGKSEGFVREERGKQKENRCSMKGAKKRSDGGMKAGRDGEEKMYTKEGKAEVPDEQSDSVW